MHKIRYLIAPLVGATLLNGFSAQAADRVAGPMVGHTSETQSHIWIQTRQDAKVTVRYWPQSNPGNIEEVSGVSSEQTFFTATLKLDQLTPNQRYEYEVLLDGEKIPARPNQSFKTAHAPGAPDDLQPLKVLLGSCFFVNDGMLNALRFGYAGGYEIFDALAKTPADMMFWMGDNSYFNPYDLNNVWSMNRRVREHRSYPAIQPFLSQLPQYATWDDHDYGPNNSNRHFELKNEALRLFKTYWPNPRSGLLSTPGVFFKMQRQDVDFFFTDNRFYRDPDSSTAPDKSFLGPEQMNWLKTNLKSSQSTFKVVVVGNPVLNRFYNESFFRYQKELNELLNWLETYQIEGVIFLSGDRHHSDLVKLPRPKAYPIYNFTVSPLTSLPTQSLNPGEGTDNWRVPGSLLQARNFGLFQVSGPRNKRKITLQLRDQKGKLRWEYTIQESDLKYPKAH